MNGAARRAGSLRTWFEAAAWVVLVLLLWGSDLLVKFAERDEFGIGKGDFRLVAEQATSATAVLLMIPFVIVWLRKFPLQLGAWTQAVVGHTVGTIIFAAGHYSLMVLMRMAVYAIAGAPYIWREPFLSNLVLEYQKDIKVYVAIVAIVTAYRFFARTRQGAPESVRSGGRLLVQTGSGESILRFEQIDYLEAARNYVSVYSGGREYLVRETLANLERKLPREKFARAHRSYVVNVDRIREIRSVDSGHQLVLDDGASIPLSRGYRDAFRKAFTGI